MKFHKYIPLVLVFIFPKAFAELMVGGSYYKSTSAEMHISVDSTHEDDIDIDLSGMKLFVGYKTDSNNRIKLTYDLMNVEANKTGVDEDLKGLSIDWEYVFGRSRVKPYWGFGFARYAIEDAIILRGTDREGDSVSAYGAQVGTGAKFEIASQLEVDLSYRVQVIISEEVDVQIGSYTDEVQSFYVSSSINAGLSFAF